MMRLDLVGHHRGQPAQQSAGLGGIPLVGGEAVDDRDAWAGPCGPAAPGSRRTRPRSARCVAAPPTTAAASSSASRRASVIPWVDSGSFHQPASPTSAQPGPYGRRSRAGSPRKTRTGPSGGAATRSASPAVEPGQQRPLRGGRAAVPRSPRRARPAGRRRRRRRGRRWSGWRRRTARRRSTSGSRPGRRRASSRRRTPRRGRPPRRSVPPPGRPPGSRVRRRRPRAGALGPGGPAAGRAATTPTTRPAPSRARSVTARPKRNSRAGVLGGVDEQRRRGRCGAGRTGHRPRRTASARPAWIRAVVERHPAHRRRAGRRHPVQQSPAPQLQDAAAHQRMGGQRVRAAAGAVHDEHPQTGAGEQQRGRGAGDARADDDGVPAGRPRRRPAGGERRPERSCRVSSRRAGRGRGPAGQPGSGVTVC